jgi:hypothetical protein
MSRETIRMRKVYILDNKAVWQMFDGKVIVCLSNEPKAYINREI